MTVGTHVKLLKSLIGVVHGTQGVIDYISPKLVWVAWDLPGRPLPEGYNKWDARAYTLFHFRREAFEPDEAREMLEPLPDAQTIQ